MTSSPFCRLVYDEVALIPKGEVRTYAMIASAIDRPGAARAVGSCLKRNFDPQVPCHRVIKSNGELGAYNRGGTDQKRRLLTAEGWRG